MSSRANVRGGVNTEQQQMDVNAERTAVICAALKSLYAKYVLPLEKKYQYDYFFESPFLSDVEFDGKNSFALEVVGKRVCRNELLPSRIITAQTDFFFCYSLA